MPNQADLVYCSRTLNMRAIKAIGYDMDYTLIHYQAEEWERRAYEYLKVHFAKLKWPVEKLEFEPNRIVRGLIVDRETGNIIKANRFGLIKKAIHGTRELSYDEIRSVYSRTFVDLSETRWYCLNTLFSLSEGCIYSQLVDLLDARLAPAVLGYKELFDLVRKTIDYTHMEGSLKADILSDPARYVYRDQKTALTLIDQHFAGRKLLLVTNSEWSYTHEMMTYCFDPFLKGFEGLNTWRDLFDVIIVGARKPAFFSSKNNSLFEVVTDDGLLRPAGPQMHAGRAYLGGSAGQIEDYLRVSGDEILYVGDHMFGDVLASKSVLRWRTCLILQELEEEIVGSRSFAENERKLSTMMTEKETLEREACDLRLKILRHKHKYPAEFLGTEPEAELTAKYDANRKKIESIDLKLKPLAEASSQLNNPHWGLLMRTGNDKSLLAHQVERYADIYTSKVSNFLGTTPYAFMRSPRGSLPHDRLNLKED